MRSTSNGPARLAGGLAAIAWFGATTSTAMAADTAPTFTGIVIGTYQHASRSDINGTPADDEASAAIDLSVSLPAAGGALELEVKGGTTPGTSDEGGRIVPWQIFYRHEVGNGSLAVGLIDAAAWLDGNDVANDEFTQFLGASFVNNSTIDMPSASAGAAYTAALGRSWGLTLLAANARGVEPSYRTAFELGREDHGLFTALQVEWTGTGMSANAGVWFNSRHHDGDGDGIDDDRLSDARGRGAYGNLSGALGQGQWNLRLGWADPDVQAAAGFAAIAYAHPIGKTVLGAAIGRTFVSHQLRGARADVDQAEVYLRLPLTHGFSVTADLQHVRHSGFDPARDGAWVTGVRAAWAF